MWYELLGLPSHAMATLTLEAELFADLLLVEAYYYLAVYNGGGG